MEGTKSCDSKEFMKQAGEAVLRAKAFSDDVYHSTSLDFRHR
jgi:hypothetical protein